MSKELPPEPKPSDPSFKKVDVNKVVEKSRARKLIDTYRQTKDKDKND